MRLQASLLLILCGLPFGLNAQVTTTIVDIGAGLCTVTEMPGNRYFVYDTGPHNGNRCRNAVQGVVGSENIGLMVVSHNDADHYGGIDNIFLHPVERNDLFPLPITRSKSDYDETLPWELPFCDMVPTIQLEVDVRA